MERPLSIPSVRPGVVELIHYYRALGFFQNTRDLDKVPDPRDPEQWERDIGGGWMHVQIGLPLPAHARMSDEQIADLIIGHHRRSFREDFIQSPTVSDLTLLHYDPFRYFEFDSMGYEDGFPLYVDLLHGLSRISRGTFVPTNIREGRELQSDGILAQIVFEADGRERELDLRDLDTNLDVRIILYVNDVIASTGLQFHYVDTGGPAIALICLTNAEKRKLEAERGLPFLSLEPEE